MTKHSSGHMLEIILNIKEQTCLFKSRLTYILTKQPCVYVEDLTVYKIGIWRIQNYIIIKLLYYFIVIISLKGLNELLQCYA